MTPSVSATTSTGKRPVVATATARRAVFPSGGERLLKDFDFHGLAAQEALQFTDTLFEFAGFVGRDDAFIGFDGNLRAGYCLGVQSALVVRRSEEQLLEW